jgi:aspartate dehydrogenase
MGVRIGLVGFGFIGRQLYQRLSDGDSSIDVSFVHNRDHTKLSGLPPSVVLRRLENFEKFESDLIVEAAHPSITECYGARFLATADYMPVSVNGLADVSKLRELVDVAETSGHRLFIPHGALIGCENLVESKALWQEVSIKMRKPAVLIQEAELKTGTDADSSVETVLYEGPVSGIFEKYPQNVNAMVACALATVGIDRCQCRLVADQRIDHAVLEIECIGRDGSKLFMRKEAPMEGVSGAEMFESTYHSVLRAVGAHEPLAFV